MLTSCDAFEHFPPPILKPFIAAAKAGPAFDVAIQPLRTGIGRKRAFGALAFADIDDLVKEWLRPALTDRRVRSDIQRFTASLNQQSTVKAAGRLAKFDKPALIAWSADDAFFALEDGHRLAEVLPDSRFEVIEHSRTFSMIDQPDTLAGADRGLRRRAAAGGSRGRSRERRQHLIRVALGRPRSHGPNRRRREQRREARPLSASTIEGRRGLEGRGATGKEEGELFEVGVDGG